MSDPAPSSGRHLPFLTKVSYAIGSIAFGLKAVAIGVVMLFYNQVLGLPAVWVSMAIGAALIVDAIASPVIGQLSDMWRSRWGRRHPFMYAAAVPASLAVWALLNPPQGWMGSALAAYMTSCIVAARVSIALFEIPNASLLPELAPGYDDRTVLSGYRNLLLIVVPVIMIVTALILFLTPFVNEHGQAMPGQLNPAGYAKYGLALAVMIFLSIMLSALGTHREIRHLSQPERHPSVAALFATIATTLLNRNFLVLTIAGVIAGIGTGLVGGLTDYFNTFFWELSARQISALTGAIGLSPFAAVAIGPFFARRFGKKRALLGTFTLSLIAGILPVSLRLLGLLPPNGSLVILPLLVADAFFACTLVIVGLIVLTSMMADIVEQVQMQTGRRSEGLLFSADTMLKQIVTGVVAMGTGLILQFVHFPEKAVPGQVPQEVLTHLATIYLPINASTSLLSIAVISLFSITRQDHERHLAGIAGVTTIEPETENELNLV
jgi:Na+/melibiose symporter-like transporter